jgi:hypothetical protein
MKLQYWVTIVAVSSSLWGSVCVLAQGVHGPQSGPPFTMPFRSLNRPVSVGNFLPHFDPALPNRRVPSLAPPQSGDIHPVAPDKAWPLPLPSIKPVRPPVTSGAGNIAKGEPLSGKGRLSIEESLESSSGTDSLLGQ